MLKIRLMSKGNAWLRRATLRNISLQIHLEKCNHTGPADRISKHKTKSGILETEPANWINIHLRSNPKNLHETAGIKQCLSQKITRTLLRNPSCAKWDTKGFWRFFLFTAAGGKKALEARWRPSQKVFGELSHKPGRMWRISVPFRWQVFSPWWHISHWMNLVAQKRRSKQACFGYLWGLNLKKASLFTKQQGKSCNPTSAACCSPSAWTRTPQERKKATNPLALAAKTIGFICLTLGINAQIDVGHLERQPFQSSAFLLGDEMVPAGLLLSNQEHDCSDRYFQELQQAVKHVN